MKIEIYQPEIANIFPHKLILEELFSQAVWAEGPVWLKQEKAIIFSDVKGNKMYKWQEGIGTQVFRFPSDFANGNACLDDGTLITCQHGNRSISCTSSDGQLCTLIDKFDGRRFNSPNDVVVKSDGSIWFTDPPYGILSNEEGYQAASEIIGCYVYCYDPKKDQVNLATFNTMRPNGLAFSPDERLLYIADMSKVEFRDGLHHLVVFDVEGNKLTNRRVLCEITPGIPDGFCVDKLGRIYCSCDDGIIVISPEGKYLAKITIGKTVSNCTFGGVENNQLYITATNSLYRLCLELT